MENSQNSQDKKSKRPRIGEPRPAGSSEGSVFPSVNNESTDTSSSSSTQYHQRQYQPRPYQPRPYQDRQQGGYQPRPYQPGGYQPRFNNHDGQQGGYKPRYQPGGYQPRPYQPRPDHDATATDSSTKPVGDDNSPSESSIPAEHQGGYQPRYNQQNGYQPRYNNNREGQQGGYRPRYNNNQGGYQPRYNNRDGQQGGYKPRYNNPDGNQQGGYKPRYNNPDGNQQGGYKPRFNNNQGGYKPRFNNQEGGQQGGYKPRFNNQGGQQGGYKPRFNNNQGGYKPRFNNPDGQNRQQRPATNQFGMPKGGKSFIPRPKPVEYEQPIPDPNEQIRLNKYMANAGICSRREADEFISQGLVKVNGEVVTELGTKITCTDVVEYDEKVVTLERKTYILLNKPKDCVTTSDDPNGRTTVLDLVKGACNERIYPVGRLDRNTTGVLLLTNDGDLASKLTHPKFVKKKIYHVWTDKDITEEDMQAIADGIELDDGPIHADAISYATETDRNQAGIEIHSGRNRIVRRIFEKLGYRVTKLDRVYFAGLTKKNLPRGRWRYLTQDEVNFLKMGSFE
ncbi:MAG: pseudouridine synthase [Bacteroides sp.]|nr:pseudouridine synthase [Bacteroides sp.]